MKKLLLVIPLVILLCFTFGCQQGEEVAEELVLEKRLPIIDVHVHAWSAWKGEKPDYFPENLYLTQTDEELMNENLERFERLNIVKAVAFGEAVKKWKEASPERIISGWQTGIVGTKQEHLDSLRNALIDGQIEVIGEVLAQYYGIAPNDPLFNPYWDMAEELDVPVGIHMGLGPPGIAFTGSPKYRMQLSNPLLLEEVLIKHPKLRVYVMHSGWPFLSEMIGLLYACPQVYVDIGAINWAIPRAEFHTYLRRLVEAGFGKRIMFGSDQLWWPETIEMAIEGVESAEFLTEEQKRDIFYNNAVKFFKLEDKDQ